MASAALRAPRARGELVNRVTLPDYNAWDDDDFRREVRAFPGQIVHVTEFMHPRVQEIADTLPAGLGRRLRSCVSL